MTEVVFNEDEVLSDINKKINDSPSRSINKKGSRKKILILIIFSLLCVILSIVIFSYAVLSSNEKPALTKKLKNVNQTFYTIKSK